jgi:hypothetical protein
MRKEGGPSTQQRLEQALKNSGEVDRRKTGLVKSSGMDGRNPMSRYVHEPVLDLEIASPYCDLAVTRIDVTEDYNAGRIGAAAVITNLGTEPPTGPFCVRMQMLTNFDQVEATDQEFWWFPASAAFPFRTPFATMELRSFDEGGDTYTILGAVDVTEAVVDRTRYNNFRYRFWYPFGPRFAPGSKQTLRREIRVENGERKVTTTLKG